MLGILVGFVAEARIARRLAPLVVVGNGTAAGARRGVDELLERGATSLLSFGLAGGVAPGLQAGALVIPPAVLVASNTVVCDEMMVRRLQGPLGGTILACTGIIASKAEKATIYAETGAAAVDLESGAIATAASMAGLPFAVLRVICDPADRSLPHAALLALSPSGRIRLGAILMILARQPTELPAMLRLAGDAAIAQRQLRLHVRALGKTLTT